MQASRQRVIEGAMHDGPSQPASFPMKIFWLSQRLVLLRGRAKLVRGQGKLARCHSVTKGVDVSRGRQLRQIRPIPS